MLWLKRLHFSVMEVMKKEEGALENLKNRRNRTRTDDNLFVRQGLYQLSYAPFTFTIIFYQSGTHESSNGFIYVFLLCILHYKVMHMLYIPVSR